MCQGFLRRFFGTLDPGIAGAGGKRDLASSEIVLLPIPEDAALVRTSVQLLLVVRPSRLGLRLIGPSRFSTLVL